MLPLRYLLTALDAAGTLLIVLNCGLCLWQYLRHAPLLYATERLRLQFGQALLFALQFKLAAGLIRSLLLRNWQELAVFVALLALRFLLGQAFKRITMARLMSGSKG